MPVTADITDIIIVGVFVVLALVVLFGFQFDWLTASRSCPRCGERVAKGKLDCQNCGFDFTMIGA